MQDEPSPSPLPERKHRTSGFTDQKVLWPLRSILHHWTSLNTSVSTSDNLGHLIRGVFLRKPLVKELEELFAILHLILSGIQMLHALQSMPV